MKKNKQRNLNAYDLNLFIKSKTNFNKVSKYPIDYPTEYITNLCSFYGNDFFVNEKVLIPRIESEKCIQIAIQCIQSKKYHTIKCIDVGTGSGCLGITLALELEKLKKTFNILLSDISTEALEVCKINLKKYVDKISDFNKIKIVKSDLLNNIPKSYKFNLIIANLPYVPIKKKLQNSTKYEPKIAIYAKDNGLELIKKLIKQSINYLHHNGTLILEVHETHNLNKIIHVLPKKVKKLFSFISQKDLFGKNRFWVLTKKET